MTPNPDHYAYRVFWSPEDEAFVGCCVEFPSLSFLAKTQAAALSGMRRLVRSVVDDIEADGEQVPAPLAGRRYSGQFRVRVTPEQHRRLAIEAAEQGVSLNRLVSFKLSA